MTTELTTTKPIDAALVDKLILQGDLNGLSQTELVTYYQAVCKRAGLDWTTKPFDIVAFQSGKKVLYANKTATAQLTAIHKPSVRIVDRATVNGAIVVTAEVTKVDGSSVQDVGAVAMPTSSADAVANAMMKATTKAKRRAILSAFGLGSLDESEAEDIADAKFEVIDLPPTDSLVLDTIAALESCEDAATLTTITQSIGKMSIERKDALRQSVQEAATRLGLKFVKGNWVEVGQ